MKKYILMVLFIGVFAGCSKDDDNNNNNPYLPNYSFSAEIDMTLPTYSQLIFTGNPVFVNRLGVGITDVIVMNTGSGYVAFEATCPNQPISQCSAMTINGINAVCPCDGVEYNLFSGQSTLEYPLKGYRIEQISTNLLRISN